MAERIVTCPACRGPSVYGPANRWRPFCSERCRQIDLGAWASEGYRVPQRPGAEDDPDGSPTIPRSSVAGRLGGGANDRGSDPADPTDLTDSVSTSRRPPSWRH